MRSAAQDKRKGPGIAARALGVVDGGLGGDRLGLGRGRAAGIGQHHIGRGLRSCSNAEDRPLILAQPFDPALQICGMVFDMVPSEAQARADERGAELCHQLLERIGGRSELVALGAIEAAFMASPVAKLVCQGGKVSGAAGETCKFGHNDMVSRRAVIGRTALLEDSRAAAAQRRLGFLVALNAGDQLQRLAGKFRLVGQAVDLVDIENGVGAQHGHRALDFFAGLLVLVGDVELFEENDLCALFALADGAAKIEGLLERHPGAAAQAFLLVSQPQQQDIDAAIGLAIDAVRCLQHSALPFLLPGFRAGLEGRDDGVCNFLIGVKLRHGARSFLTTLADHSDGVKSSYKPELLSLSSDYLRAKVIGCGHGAKAPCQYIKYARSGRAADAVREHSFFAAIAATPTRVAGLDRLPLLFSLLTPARCDASRLAVQYSGPSGLGGAVPRFQGWNHCENRQASEIISKTSPVLRFQRLASRHARVRTCAGLRAYMCARKAGTLEPLIFIYVYQIDVGSVLGSSAGTLEPALPAMPQWHGFLPLSIKIGGRYVGKGASRGLKLGGGGEKFGVFVLGGSIGGLELLDQVVIGMDPRAAAAIGQSDGFLRVSAGRSGRVGMASLEWNAQRRRNARFLVIWPLPIGKGTHPGRSTAPSSAGHPPMPPSAIAPTSSSIAPEAGQILDRFPKSRLLIISGHRRCRWIGAPRTGWRQTGSGEGGGRHSHPPVAGRGGKAAGKLRRFSQANGGWTHVN